MTDWDQIIADIGWELKYVEIPLVDGAMDIADVDSLITSFGAEGWEIVAIGHHPVDGTTQCCLRRAVPGRDEHIEQVKKLRSYFQRADN